MKRIGMVCACLMLAAVSAFAQGTIDAERLSIWTGGSIRANLTAGSGAPSSGTLGDYYIDYLTANLYRRISGSWEVVPMVSLTNTWTAAQAFNAGWTGTTGSLSSTLHVGGNFDVGTTKFTVAPGTPLVTINGNAATLPSPLAGTLLQIGNADGTATRISLDAFANAAQVTLRRASNTAAAPSALANGDIIGRVGGLGYGATGYAAGSRASVDFVAAQTWTDSAQGAYLGLMTTSNGSTTLTERVRVHQSGGVSIGTPTTDPGANVLGVTADILPFTNNTSNLGSLTKRMLGIWGSELNVETLVAQSTLATIGGRVIVAPTTYLTADLAPAGTTLTVKHNNIANGDRIVLQTAGSLEWMAVTSAAGGSAGAYTYTVTRNLDGSGADQWYSGDAVVDTGTTGNGFIDLYSVSGISAGTTGPTIVGNVRTGTTYNNIAPRWAIGNLDGLYSYSGSTYGAAFGDASGSNITVDATNGVRIRQGTTNYAVLASSTLTLGAPGGQRLTWDGTNLTIVSDTLTVDTNGVTVTPNNSGSALAQKHGFQFTPTTGDFGVYGREIGGGTPSKLLAILANGISGSGNNGIFISTVATTGITLTSGTTAASSAIDMRARTLTIAGDTGNQGALSVVADLTITDGSSGTNTLTIQPGTGASAFFGTSSADDVALLANNATQATLCSAGGVTLGAPTGGCKGAGTLNAAGDIYKNNTAYTNPDYVFEHWATGKIERFAGNPGAATYAGLMPLDDLRRYIRTNYRFPMISDAPVGAFGRADLALALTEQNTLYIFELEARVRALEQKGGQR